MHSVRILLLSLLIMFGSHLLARSQSPLPKPFEHTHDEFVAAFDKRQVKVDEPSGRETLLHEVLYSFSEQGTLTKSIRSIWRVNQSGLADNGTLAYQFSPWYQKQPIVRARVFDRNGKAYEFDKDDMTVSPAHSADPAVLTNNLVVRAALPGLQDGAIVEQLVTTEEQAPFFAAGRYYMEMLDSFEPIAFRSIEIETPASLPLEAIFLGRDFSIQKTASDNRIRRRIEIHNQEKLDLDSFEEYRPRGEYSLNQVAIVLGESWEKVSAAYSKLVDRKISETQFADLLKEMVPAEAKSKMEKLQASIQWIKKNIRYTGLELGEASIVPAAPMQVIARRFGDCKDQATFLVGMLREQGIDANVALVNTTGFQFPNKRIVGLNAFNHAIAVANIDGQQYWIDCTSLGSTISNVPYYLQGKLALIAGENQSLTQIPLASPVINSRVEEKELELKKNRTLTVRSTETYSGFQAVPVREQAISETIEQSEKYYTELLQQEVPEASFRILKQDDAWTAENEFHRTSEINGLLLEEVSYTVYRHVLNFSRLFEYLPQAYLLEPVEEKQTRSRKHSAEVFEPYLSRRKYTIRAPQGWEIQAKVGERKLQIGGVGLVQKVDKQEDGSIHVLLELRAEACILTVDELRQLHEITSKFDDITSDWNTTVLFREKEPEEEFTRVQLVRNAKLNWESQKTGEALVDYVSHLCDAALVDEARWVANKAVKEIPQDAKAYIALGVANMVDLGGRNLYPGMNRQEAERAFLRAKELDPKDLLSYHYLSMLAFHDLDSVERYTVGDAPKCLQIIKECEAATGSMTLAMRDLQISCLASEDRIPEAIAIADQNRLERMGIILRCFEYARAARWGEVKKLRERIGNDPALKTMVLDTVKGYLLNRRLYSTTADFIEAFIDPNEHQNLELAKALRKRVPTEVDQAPSTTPQRVAAELIRRIHLSGTQFERWGDIISNPSASDPQLENSLSLDVVVDVRSFFRKRAIDRNGVSRAVLVDVKAEGDDETGYRCRVNHEYIKATVFVLKQPQGYQVLLSGKEREGLVGHAKRLASEGKLDAAIKWIGWGLNGVPAAGLLDAESGEPAKTIWDLNRKKTPELVDQVLKMLEPWDGMEQAKYEEAKAWIDSEKSKARKTQYWLHMLKNLCDTNSPHFIDEAKQLLQLQPAFVNTRYKLITRLLESGRVDEAKAVFKEGSAHYSAVSRIETERLFNQASSEFSENLPILKKRLDQLPDSGSWNSFLWESTFAEKLQAEDVRNAVRVIRPLYEPYSLHSLACAEASTGMVSEAIEDLRKLMAIQGEKLAHADWLVIGMIAEQCDLWQAALRAYEKVEEQREQPSLTSAYDLAQIRIRAIRAKQAQ